MSICQMRTENRHCSISTQNMQIISKNYVINWRDWKTGCRPRFKQPTGFSDGSRARPGFIDCPVGGCEVGSSKPPRSRHYESWRCVSLTVCSSDYSSKSQDATCI